MEKFIVIIDCGYGEEVEVIDAESQEDADKIAYDLWRESAESNACYEAHTYTEEMAENYGVEE